MAGGGAALVMRDDATATSTTELCEQEVLRPATMTGGAAAHRQRSCVAAAKSYELLPWRVAELHRCMQQALRQ